MKLEEHIFQDRGLYYRASEIRPDRPTIVFVHGLSPSSAVWLRYEPYFASDYNIVSPDLRGHGKSKKPTHYEDFTVEKMADDVDALLSHLGVGAYIPVSSSLSSLIVLALMRMRPGAITAVFLNPLYGTRDLFLTKISRGMVAGAAAIARCFRYSDKPGKHTDYTSIGHVWDWSPSLMIREIPNTTLHVYLFCLDQLYARDYDAWYKDVRIPILIIHGEHDSISPAREVRKLVASLPNAELRMFENGDHVLPLNFPDEVARAMVAFIHQHAPIP